MFVEIRYTQGESPALINIEKVEHVCRQGRRVNFRFPFEAGRDPVAVQHCATETAAIQALVLIANGLRNGSGLVQIQQFAAIEAEEDDDPPF